MMNNPLSASALPTAANAKDSGSAHIGRSTVWADDTAWSMVGHPSLLLFADPLNKGSLPQIASATGFRILVDVPVVDAEQKLSQIVDFDAVLIRCSGHESGLDLLLARLDTLALTQDVGLIIIVGLDGLDRVHAIINAPRSLILCEPSPTELALALAQVANRNRDNMRLNDIGAEGSPDSRIDKLSDELLRLSRTIEALVENRQPSEYALQYEGRSDFAVRSPERAFSAFPEAGGDSKDHAINASQVRAVLRGRRLRDDIFSPDLFADPAWDILLDLMAARLENTKVSVSSLCIAAAVPPTTALRWIRQLTERGLLERRADPHDGRRIFIALTDEGADAVTRWFVETRNHMLHALGQGSERKESMKSLV